MNNSPENRPPATFGVIASEAGEVLPKGLGVVLTEQSTGFWNQLDNEPAKPEFNRVDVSNSIYTFEPWIGCL